VIRIVREASVARIVCLIPYASGLAALFSSVSTVAAATDDLFRAIDIDTGDVLWETTLPGGGQSSSFAFEVDGKQYVGLMTGGHHFMETPIGDQVIAWALPGE
jgi:quinoprotein glucose dehydrogenase